MAKLASSVSTSLKSIADHYMEYGYAVIRGYLSMADVSKIAAESDAIIDRNWPEVERRIQRHGIKKPILDSTSDYLFALNPVGFDENGKLKTSERNAISFIGWKLHVVNDVIKRFTNLEQNKAILKYLGFKSPVLFQTGLLHKVPGDGRLDLHQDEAYIDNEPKGLALNFWIAIDDATEENGCLEFIPGSHKTVNYRKVALTEKNAYQDVDMSKIVKVTAKKSDLVLINSLVVHGSGENRTETLRRSLAFSVYDKQRVKWSKENYIQDGDVYKFLQLY